MTTVLERAQARAAAVFADPKYEGLIKRAAIRYAEPGLYRDGAADVGEPADLPCKALLLQHSGQPADLRIEPRTETWLLEGISRTVDAQGLFLEPDPLLVKAARQFEPAEGQLMLVEVQGGEERFIWTGGVALFGDAKAILAAQDVTAGGGVLWSVTVRQP